ncbi:hypothetical protein V6N12_021413 [Hibiscus sabdariffa]|uniref:Uncharacterized protein n=1 Tax=Hibiscus sabdariffa TaxID=183260 RepID=A0ABR2FRS2_9ROSI
MGFWVAVKSRCMKQEFPEMPKVVAKGVVAAKWGSATSGAAGGPMGGALTEEQIKLMSELQSQMRRELQAIDDGWDSW